MFPSDRPTVQDVARSGIHVFLHVSPADEPLTVLEHVLGQSLRPVDDRERYWITPAGRLALLEAEYGGDAA